MGLGHHYQKAMAYYCNSAIGNNWAEAAIVEEGNHHHKGIDCHNSLMAGYIVEADNHYPQFGNFDSLLIRYRVNLQIFIFDFE